MKSSNLNPRSVFFSKDLLPSVNTGTLFGAALTITVKVFVDVTPLLYTVAVKVTVLSPSTILGLVTSPYLVIAGSDEVHLINVLSGPVVGNVIFLVTLFSLSPCS
ncbi:hypothetical protein D3C76_536680 [compost metagenome]